MIPIRCYLAGTLHVDIPHHPATSVQMFSREVCACLDLNCYTWSIDEVWRQGWWGNCQWIWKTFSSFNHSPDSFDLQLLLYLYFCKVLEWIYLGDCARLSFICALWLSSQIFLLIYSFFFFWVRKRNGGKSNATLEGLYLSRICLIWGTGFTQPRSIRRWVC